MLRYRLGLLLLLAASLLGAESHAGQVPVASSVSPSIQDVPVVSAQGAATLFVTTAALTERPWGVICDPNGAMVVACNDFGIRKVDPRGQVTGFSRIHPEFVGPGMAFDKGDNLLIADGKSILRIDPGGNMTTLFSGFTRALDIRVDPQGNMYVADDIEDKVYRITPSLNKAVFIDRQLSYPMWFALSSIAFDSRFENLYLAERLSGTILRYPVNPDGTAGQPEVFAEGIVGLRFLAIDAADNVYANTDFPLLIRIDKTKRRQFGFLPEFEDAAGMNFGRKGFDEKPLYLSHRYGIVQVHVGMLPSSWAVPPQGQSSSPLSPVPKMESFIQPAAGEIALGIAFNPQGYMFLAYNDSSIRRVLPARRIARYATPGVTFVSMGGGYLQRGMAFDSQNNLYVTDGQNILMIDPQGKASKVLSGFSDAIDLKIDPHGGLFVADAMEGRVYRINRAMERSVFVDRGYQVRMREMLSGIDFDAKAENLYLAERLTGQILRYPIQADGTAGRPEVMASGLVALRSIAVDDGGDILASIDFPIIVRIDHNKKQRQYVITGCQDFLIGRIALGRSDTDKASLYVPTNTGVVKLDLAEDMGH